MRAEFECTGVTAGAQCVMTRGPSLMLVLHADNWDTPKRHRLHVARRSAKAAEISLWTMYNAMEQKVGYCRAPTQAITTVAIRKTQEPFV